MSELINTHDNRATIRWKLLTGASALALAAYVSSTAMANAEDASQPQLWIELGAQLNRLEAGRETFSPSFETAQPSIFSPPEKFEGPPLYGIGEFAGLSFRPEKSDWIFTASIQYGRAISDRSAHQQTYPAYGSFPSALINQHPRPRAARFTDTQARNTENYNIIDFSVGKDVGLGLLGGKDASSSLNLGVRFAQFRSKSNIAVGMDPDWHFGIHAHMYTSSGIFYSYRFPIQPYHSYGAGLVANRSFSGVGPSLSWKASVPFAGEKSDGELSIDWGLNAAMLFGRQKTRTQHHMTARYNDGGLGYGVNPGHLGQGNLLTTSQTAPPPVTRSRNVTVPNVGGFVGLSYSYADAKISFGYKADFFFGAIDGGIDVRKNENRAFYGPYASISIGLGD